MYMTHVRMSDLSHHSTIKHDCPTSLISIANSSFEQVSSLTSNLHSQYTKKLVETAQLVSQAFVNGGKVLVMGNGGSCADADHVATEFLVRFTSSIDREPLPAISLSNTATYLTACSNDYSFDQAFLRSFQAFYREGDVLMFFSTSGKSPNILSTLKYSNRINCPSIGFTGLPSSPCSEYTTHLFPVQHDSTARIQEVHRVLYHVLIELIEDILFRKK